MIDRIGAMQSFVNFFIEFMQKWVSDHNNKGDANVTSDI